MMYTMEQEVPHILYTYQMNSIIDITDGCEKFYGTHFGFDAEL